MSRIRILNLPNDCTEDRLRQHLLHAAPPDGPLLEITDVQIVRRQQLLHDRRRIAASSQQASHHRSAKNDRRKDSNGSRLVEVVRMAFVGFRTAAAGNFMVQYLHHSFMGSSRLRVELARGLNDVALTTNQLIKQKQQQKRAEKVKQRSPNPADEAPVKQARVESEEGEVSMRTAGSDGRAAFIDARRRATEGPTWAAEVLTAPEAVAVTSAVSKDGDDGVVAHISDGVPAADDDDDDDAEVEARALERQAALGGVSDADFLAGLSSSGGASTTTTAVAAVKETEEPTTVAPSPPVADEGKEGEEATSGLTKAEKDTDAEAVVETSRRICLQNIPYIATEDQVRQFAASLVGPVEAVHIPLTKDTRQSKGNAYVQFQSASDAVAALQRCRGSIFMGRLLRVSAAAEDPHGARVREREAALVASGGIASNAGASAFKKARAAARSDGDAAPTAWNSMYMNSHAAVEAVAKRLGVQSGDVVGIASKGAAVRAAIAEAYLTSEVQQVLSDEGVALDLLEEASHNLLKARSNTTILVKNLHLKDGEEAAALTRLFVRFGVLETSVFPTAGTFALFRFAHPQDARIAFTRLSYKLFQASPLFLEWAPVGALIDDAEAEKADGQPSPSTAAGGDADTAESLPLAATVVYTLFITNIAFQVTEDQLSAFLQDACPRLARSPQLLQRLSYQQDKGRAFLTVADATTFAYCMARLQGRQLNGRVLSCVASTQTASMQTLGRDSRSTATAAGGSGTGRHADDDEEEDPGKASVVARQRGQGLGDARGGHSKVPAGSDPLKIIVKNLPFEATEKDVRELFSAFSEIRTVRLPRKSHAFTAHRENNHRGFAFVEFLSAAEAARALETLKATHLYGRHLVLQYAKLDG